jgi:preprotein translocase subunit SecE
MATQAAKVKNEETPSSAITGVAAGVGEKVSGSLSSAREFLHDTRVEMKQVTWPTRNDVVSTTGVVIATVFFFGVFLAAVDWLVQLGVTRIMKLFGV